MVQKWQAMYILLINRRIAAQDIKICLDPPRAFLVSSSEALAVQDLLYRVARRISHASPSEASGELHILVSVSDGVLEDLQP